MTTTRREFIGLAATAGVTWHSEIHAQAKPLYDTLNMFVPAAPGGGWDVTARAVERAARAAGLVGTMAFENVAGAGGMVGLPRYVNQRKGQGNSLLMGGSVMVSAALANRSPVTMRNLTPIARLIEEAIVVVVPASGRIKTWAALAAALKAGPRAVPVAGGSAGGTDHLVLGLIIKSLGRNPREAAYVAFSGGGPANAALLGGQVTAGISGYSELQQHLKTGGVIPLAVAGNKRIPDLNVPTLTELGVPVSAANWRGVFAPPAINAAQRAALVNFMTRLHASGPWQQELQTRRWLDVFLAGPAFEREIDANIRATEAVMKDLGLA